MKRVNNIFEEITEIENLTKAFFNAKKGKRHYREVKEVYANYTDYLLALQSNLKSGGYKNSNYSIFTLITGNKERIIYKLPFYPDRIVHHAIVQVLKPIWMKILIRNTFATIPGRGIHDGVERVKKSLKDLPSSTYALKMDVHKFFPSINHNILEEILRRKIKDEDAMSLLNEIIYSAPGVPIGNYISQWFSNLYLAYFDHWVKESMKAKYYFRYADDMVVLASDKNYLHNLRKQISEYLKMNLELELKDNWQVFPVHARGLDFLGYKFYHTHTLIRKNIKENFKQKVKNKQPTKQNQSSYWGWFKYADTHNLVKKYFAHETIF